MAEMTDAEVAKKAAKDQEAAVAEREAARRRAAQTAYDEAQARADEFQRKADALKADIDPPKVKTGKGAGTDPGYTEGVSLHDHQIAVGDTPLAPGPEKPVSETDARLANENRGT